MEIASKYTYRIHGSVEWAPMLSDLPEAVQSHIAYDTQCASEEVPRVRARQDAGGVELHVERRDVRWVRIVT